MFTYKVRVGPFSPVDIVYTVCLYAEINIMVEWLTLLFTKI